MRMPSRERCGPGSYGISAFALFWALVGAKLGARGRWGMPRNTVSIVIAVIVVIVLIYLIFQLI
jgi:uncharacterized membrane protein YfcA